MEEENIDLPQPIPSQSPGTTDVEALHKARIVYPKDCFYPRFIILNEQKQFPCRRSSILNEKLKTMKLPLTIHEEIKFTDQETSIKSFRGLSKHLSLGETSQELPHLEDAVRPLSDEERKHVSGMHYFVNIPLDENVNDSNTCVEVQQKTIIEEDCTTREPRYQKIPNKQHRLSKEILDELLQKTSKIREREQQMSGELPETLSSESPVTNNEEERVEDAKEDKHETNTKVEIVEERKKQPIPKPRFSIVTIGSESKGEATFLDESSSEEEYKKIPTPKPRYPIAKAAFFNDEHSEWEVVSAPGPSESPEPHIFNVKPIPKPRFSILRPKFEEVPIPRPRYSVSSTIQPIKPLVEPVTKDEATFLDEELSNKNKERPKFEEVPAPRPRYSVSFTSQPLDPLVEPVTKDEAICLDVELSNKNKERPKFEEVPTPRPRYSVSSIDQSTLSSNEEINSTKTDAVNPGILKMVESFKSPIHFSYEPQTIKVVKTTLTAPQQDTIQKPRVTLINTNEPKPIWEIPVKRMVFNGNVNTPSSATSRVYLEYVSKQESTTNYMQTLLYDSKTESTGNDNTVSVDVRPERDYEIVEIKDKDKLSPNDKIQIISKISPMEFPTESCSAVETRKKTETSGIHVGKRISLSDSEKSSNNQGGRCNQLRVDLVKIIESLEGTEKIDGLDLEKYFKDVQNTAVSGSKKLRRHEISKQNVDALMEFSKSLEISLNPNGDTIYYVDIPEKDEEDSKFDEACAVTDKVKQIPVPAKSNDCGLIKKDEEEKPSTLKMIKVDHKNEIVSFANAPSAAVGTRRIPIDDSTFEEIDLRKETKKAKRKRRCGDSAEKIKVILIWFMYVIIFTVLGLLVVIYGNKLGKKWNIW